MWIKYPVLFLLVFFFWLLQLSFFPHFSIAGVSPNLILTLFILLIFFSTQRKSAFSIYDFYIIILFGFFLNFSSNYLLIQVLLLSIIACLIKYSIFLLREQRGKNQIIYFSILFLVVFTIYHFVAPLFNFTKSNFDSVVIINFNFLMLVLYNLSFALLLFYIYKLLDSYGLSKQIQS